MEVLKQTWIILCSSEFGKGIDFPKLIHTQKPQKKNMNITNKIWCVRFEKIRQIKFQVVLVVKNPPANAGDIRDVGSIFGLGRSPGRGHDNSLQHSCLENSMDRGAWRAIVHSITKKKVGHDWSELSHTHTHTHTHTYENTYTYTYIYMRGHMSIFLKINNVKWPHNMNKRFIECVYKWFLKGGWDVHAQL